MSEVRERKDRPTALDTLLELHSPRAIYGECDHDHEEPGGEVVYIEDIGLTCKLEYSICRTCCMAWDEQSEYCAGNHDHGLYKPICATAKALASLPRKGDHAENH